MASYYNAPPPPLIPGDMYVSDMYISERSQTVSKTEIFSTIDSVNPTTGSLVVSGGIGLSDSLNAGGTITGNILISTTSSGAPLTVSSTSLVPLLYVARSAVADVSSAVSLTSLVLSGSLSAVSSTMGSLLTTGPINSQAYIYSSKNTYNQTGSPTDSVAIDRYAGTITTQSLTTASGATTVFNITGSQITGFSQIMLSPVSYSGSGTPIAFVNNIINGSATITIKNFGSVSLDAVYTFNFIII